MMILRLSAQGALPITAYTHGGSSYFFVLTEISCTQAQVLCTSA